MHATEVLQKCLSKSLDAIHALRSRVLMRAVEATIAGRRLTLIDLARAWPGAQRIRAPLEALDRLLGNRHLHAERERIHAAMVRWLVRSEQPVIIVDWSDLKADGIWHLLRAAMPVGGRTLTVLDMVFTAGQQGSPQGEKQFLQRRAAVLPENVKPILVTDAGFRGPWFRAVEAMGWHWLGRLRNRTQLKPAEAPNDIDERVPCKAMYEQYRGKTRDFGLTDVTRSAPLRARIVLHGKPPQGRKDRTRQGAPARNSNSRKSAQREREPWLLMASPGLELSMQQMVTLYTRRMQIELSFRDLKSHRYGQGFEDSLTRRGARIEVLLVLSTLAAFATWLVGIACEASGIDTWLTPYRCKRRLYSMMRLGREALVRRWLPIPVSRLLDHLRQPSASLLDQLGVPA